MAFFVRWVPVQIMIFFPLLIILYPHEKVVRDGGNRANWWNGKEGGLV